MNRYRFLSVEWIDAARLIRAEFAERLGDPDVPLKANVIVTETPFDDPEVRGFIDTTDGAMMLELGELDDAEVTVTTDYDTAQALFVAQDIAKLMESFMAGRILVTGDVSRIFALSPPTDPEGMAVAVAIAERLDAITAAEETP